MKTKKRDRERCKLADSAKKAPIAEQHLKRAGPNLLLRKAKTFCAFWQLGKNWIDTYRQKNNGGGVNDNTA